MIGEFWSRVGEFCADEDGVTTLEYAIMVALVALGSVGAWSTLIELGHKVGGVVERTSEGFTKAESVVPSPIR